MIKSNPTFAETYFELCCTVSSEWEELWSWYCFENDALGVETISESSSELTLRVFFAIKPSGGAKKLIDNFRIETAPEAKIKIIKESIRSVENWQSNWREHFRPVKVGQSLIILPSWETEFELSGRHPVWIDPGQGFGTGHHISTVLALEMLEHFIFETETVPESMLDIGIGSGILAIAACRLGITKVSGVDIEKEAVAEVVRNAELNGLSGKITALSGQPSLLKNSVSLVISNMLLSELLSVRLDLVRLTSPDGTLICSGLLANQVDEMCDSLSRLGFVFCSTLERENWCAIKFKLAFGFDSLSAD